MKIDGKKMNRLRERKLLTVREFCSACQISQRTWLKASKGENLRVTTVRKICTVLEVSPEEIELQEGNANEQ